MWERIKPNMAEVQVAVDELIGREERYRVSFYLARNIFLKKFKLENDAKFRAVDQKVATYEEFKGIVDGAHLKSLGRKENVDSILSANQHSWNTATNTVIFGEDIFRIVF